MKSTLPRAWPSGSRPDHHPRFGLREDCPLVAIRFLIAPLDIYSKVAVGPGETIDDRLVKAQILVDQNAVARVGKSVVRRFEGRQG